MSKLALNQQLWNAVVSNDLPMIEATLVAGADPDFRDTGEIDDSRHQSPYARSVLHEALLLGREEACALLLTHGAEQTCDGLYGLSPLHLAALFGREELARAMIEHGAPIDAVDGMGNNVVMAALIGEDAYDQPGTPIANKQADPELALRLVKMLIDAGADINEANEAGETPLWNAVRYQSSQTVEALIEMGANPHQATVFGTSLVAECADALNRADALGQMVWRVDESRTERQRALGVLQCLHSHGLQLVDNRDQAQMEIHYPSTKIQREIEGWWQQWTSEGNRKPASSGSAPSLRSLRR